MQEPQKRIVAIDVGAFDSREALLAHLSRELMFPAHFGMNLSALADCLGEVCSPTEILVLVPEDGVPSWAIKLLFVMEREAAENEFLTYQQY